MNICIITVYNTDNCGSYWQAHALAETIKDMGHNVSFLYRDLIDTSQSLKGQLRMFLVKSLKTDFLAACFIPKKVIAFKNARKGFRVIHEGTKEFNSVDMFVIGSDTVWNFASPYFFRHSDKYTGGRFKAERCITYAASAANTPFEVFESNEDIKTNINRLKAISVRDEDTYDIVKKLVGRDCTIVCDPTMLQDVSFYDNNAKPIDDDNFILLYNFEKIPDDIKAELLEIKKKYECKIISYGEVRKWCDKSVVYDPFTFVSYMKKARFVVTDTFHGTIFSILYRRSFAELGFKKKKIASLLNALGLNSTIVNNNISVSDLFDGKTDYSEAENKIIQLKETAIKYLHESLEK